MNREPIERLIEILKAVKDENFYIGEFYHTDNFYNDNTLLIDKTVINTRGYTACALGHAAVDPWFITRGMYAHGGTVSCAPEHIIDTLDRIFDLPEKTIANLFGLKKGVTKQFYGVKCGDVTPAMVIDKLQELLNS